MRYPKAERWAESVKLPIICCPVTKELYGYCNPILDEPRAIEMFCAAIGGSATSDACLTAIEILHERIDELP